MTTNEVNTEICKRYLLGGLDPETEQLDSRLMLGDLSLENQLGVAEDELIDEFVRGELDLEDDERFQKHFLRAKTRRRKVAFGETLDRYVDRYSEARVEARPREPSARVKPKVEFKRRFSWLWDWSPAPAWSYALAGLLLISLIGGAWAFTAKLRLEGRLEQLTSDLTTLEVQIASPSEKGAPEILSSAVATVWLSPGLLRDLGEVERLRVPADSSLVRIQLDIGLDDYGTYRAVLNDANGDELWSQSKLAAASAGDKVAVTLTLPSELLPHGDYSIRLSGLSSSGDLELVGRYYFRVVK